MRVSMRELYESGQAALNQHKLGRALNIAEQMLRANQRDHNAWVLRARVKIAQGYVTEAIDDLQQACKLQPKNPHVLQALAFGYQTAGDHFNAISMFDKALRVEPTLASAIAGKAKSYEMQGNTKRALKTVRNAVKADPPSIEAAAVYLRLLTRDQQFEQAISVGEELAAKELPENKARRDLLFALASACEKAGRYEDALHWGRLANDTLRVPFNRDRFRDFNDTLIKLFTRQRVATLPRATGHDTTQPVFIVGRPRSGSTLTERILDAHPEVHGAGEIATLHLMVMEMGMRIGSPLGYPACIQHLQPHVVEAESRAYIESVTPAEGTFARIVDKHLGNYMHLPIMHAYFPDCHVIHTHRHPMDTCVSCYFERLQPTHVPWASDFDDLAFTYAEYVRVFEHMREVVDIPVLDVSYEELVADQEMMSRRIIDFVGLPWDDACIEFHKTARTDRTLSYDQVKQPIYKTAMGRAERFGSLLDPLRDALEKYGVDLPVRS